ncbi:Phosphomethylpyrimidine kinase-domain-containing protein [Ganoderma leucocontextum]|nr:Phosphomethylpyrimidine kinase-domain-containing protein [Ganoderma leucocontextum]
MDETTPPAVLTIAGSDSSGGAGIQADLKAFMAFGCYGTSVITALTAQNTKGVQGVHPAPPDFLEQQLNSVLDDIDIKAIKTGMLFDAEHTRRVARTLKARFVDGRSIPPLVVDPVSVSTSGHTLLHPDAVDVMVQELFPLAALVTPNKPETELLLSRTANGPGSDMEPATMTIDTLEGMVSASDRLLALGPKAVLVKGGHVSVSLADVQRLSEARPEVGIVRESFLDENMEILQANEVDFGARPLVVDVLRESVGGVTLYVSPRIESTSTHGTGCTLAAAIASVLSRGESMLEAVRQATIYTHVGIEMAFPVGSGYGPLNHMHALTRRLVPPPTPSNPHPLTRILIQSSKQTWKEYVEHDFVKQLARGTLPKECFLHFIKQDYLYLKYYARAYGLLVAKSSTYGSIQSATQTIINIINEVTTHKSFCTHWGISEAELNATPESPSTTAYGAYLLDIGLQGDSAKLIMALAACLLGYGEVGLWLKHEASKPDSWVVLAGNPYLRWIEDYSGKDYQAAVSLGIETVETLAVEDAPNARRFAEWCAIWEKCTRLERGFWDASLNLL